MKPEGKLAIIGGGPAGIAAAIQLHRLNISFVLFEKETLGGLLVQARRIENYPGFPAGVTGEDLARLFRDQLSGLPVEVRPENVTSLDFDPEARRFPLASGGGRSSFERVIVASGTKPRGLPFPAPADPGLSSRVFFDWRKIPASGGTRAAVIGAGDIALDYASSLGPKHDVVILCRGEKCRALARLQKHIQTTRAAVILFQTTISGLAAGSGRPLRLAGSQAGRDFFLEADYVLCAVGREASKDFYTPRLALREPELIASGSLFLAGDVKNGDHRQTGLAVGDGIAAALAAADLIQGKPI